VTRPVLTPQVPTAGQPAPVVYGPLPAQPMTVVAPGAQPGPCGIVPPPCPGPCGIVPPPCPGPCDAPVPPAPESKLPFKYTWGGQFRVEPNISNFPFQPVVLTPEDHTQRIVVERLRLWATINPTDNVEGYIQAQFGGIQWGSNFDFNKTFNGPRFPAPADLQGDRIGISLRRGWLAYTDDDWGKVRCGILDWHDSFGDTLASSDYDFNIGGVDWTKTFKELNNLKVVAAALFLSDLQLVTTDDSPAGSHTAWLFTLDVDQPCGDKSSVGASAYWLTDQGDYSYGNLPPYKSAYDVWLGVRGKTVVCDLVPFNGFFLFNFGDRTDGEGNVVFKHAGYAGKVEAGPIPFGPGKWSSQILASSGGNQNADNNTEFRTVAQTYRDNFGAQGYWSYLYLTSPSGPTDVNGLGVSLQNRGLGLFTWQSKYEYPIYGKLSGTTAGGWLRSFKGNPVNGSCIIGTELAQMLTYDFGGHLKLDTGVSVLFTGDFYKPSPTADTPRDLYEVFARLQLEF
jgi:hypothetical protein